MSPSRFIAPEQLELMLTNRCNLRCGYCHFFDSPNEVPDELTTAEWLALLDEAGRNKVFRIILSGGEALIRDDFEEIVAGIVRNRMRFTVLSNGILLDDAKAAFLCRTGRCDHVQISLDGIGPVHDHCRGDGAFAGAVAGIRTAQKHGLKVACRISLTRYNAASLGETIRYAREELRVHSVSTNWAVGFPQNTKDATAFQMDLRMVIESIAAHKALLETYGNFISPESAPVVALLEFGNFFARIKEGRTVLAHGAGVPVCPAPACRLTVRADGAYIPCPYLPDRIAGWADRDALKDVWDHAAVLQEMRGQCLDGVLKYEKCRDCRYVAYCRISCPALETEGYQGAANCWCFRRCFELMPEFDFEKMEYRE